MSTPFVKDSRKVRETGASLLRQMALEKQLVSQRLGQQIARHRARLGLTQEEAASRVGVTHRAYQRWESGEAMPYPRNVEKIAGAFGIGVDELLSEAARTPADEDQIEMLKRIEFKLDRALGALGLDPQEGIADDLARRLGQEPPPDEEAPPEAAGQ